MNLVTVTSDSHLLNTVQLIESYNMQEQKGKVFLFVFNFSERNKKKLLNKYSNLFIEDIPHINHYIYDTKVFLFKSYALQQSINKKIDFIYSDSANVFVKDASKIFEYIHKNERLLLQYPEYIKKNKFFSTSTCFKKMNCDESRYKESQQYWAGLQGYVYNEINQRLLTDCYNYMLDVDIAFPQANIERPEGSQSDCWFHRNEQSVLSILVEKYNINQNFDYEMFNMCGDFPTVFNHEPKYQTDFDYKKIVIHPRFSNINGPAMLHTDLVNYFRG